MFSEHQNYQPLAYGIRQNLSLGKLLPQIDLWGLAPYWQNPVQVHTSKSDAVDLQPYYLMYWGPYLKLQRLQYDHLKFLTLAGRLLLRESRLARKSHQVMHPLVKCQMQSINLCRRPTYRRSVTNSRELHPSRPRSCRV